MKITFLSDTHSKHDQLTDDLTDGDVIIHSGDVTLSGYEYEVKKFLEWYSDLRYETKIFIAGNHDRFLEQYPGKKKELLEQFPDVIYLENSSTIIKENPWDTEGYKVYGSPYQPRYHNWSFNIDRDSDEIEANWNLIPDDTDILVTHGPPKGILDYVQRDFYNAGCERLLPRVYDIQPKIHSFGHIHGNFGYHPENKTMFLNVAVLSERLQYRYKPLDIEILENGKVKFL